MTKKKQIKALYKKEYNKFRRLNSMSKSLVIITSLSILIITLGFIYFQTKQYHKAEADYKEKYQLLQEEMDSLHQSYNVAIMNYELKINELQSELNNEIKSTLTDVKQETINDVKSDIKKIVSEYIKSQLQGLNNSSDSLLQSYINE